MRLRTTRLLFFLFTLGISFVLQAQPPHGDPMGGPPHGPPGQELSGPGLERVKAVRQAFLTEQMELTEEEAAAFFPIFWELERERHQMNRQARQGRPRGRLQQMTEAEAQEVLATRRAERNARHELEERYQLLFIETIPARKLMQLEFAEREFRRLLVERVRGRRSQREGNREPRDRGNRRPPPPRGGGLK